MIVDLVLRDEEGAAGADGEGQGGAGQGEVGQGGAGQGEVADTDDVFLSVYLSFFVFFRLSIFICPFVHFWHL